MRSARSAIAAFATALAVFVASVPARSAPVTIVGTVLKQSAAATIDTCTAALNGEVYVPSIAVSTTKTIVTQSFDLTFFDANGRKLGTTRVTPPFSADIAPGGAFAAMRCEIAEMKFDDGSSFSNAPRTADSHALGNALIGIGILAGIAFLAAARQKSAPAPADTSGILPTATPSPTSTPTATSGASATPTGTATAIATPSGGASATGSPSAPAGVNSAMPLVVTPAPLAPRAARQLRGGAPSLLEQTKRR